MGFRRLPTVATPRAETDDQYPPEVRWAGAVVVLRSHDCPQQHFYFYNINHAQTSPLRLASRFLRSSPRDGTLGLENLGRRRTSCSHKRRTTFRGCIQVRRCRCFQEHTGSSPRPASRTSRAYTPERGTCRSYQRRCTTTPTSMPSPSETCSGQIGRDVQPALIGRHYVTERDSAPVQYNGIV